MSKTYRKSDESYAYKRSKEDRRKSKSKNKRAFLDEPKRPKNKEYNDRY